MANGNQSWQVLRDLDLELQQREKFKPLTKNQEKYFKAVETSTITIVSGSAGTGKTYCAAGIASQMLRDKRIDRIVLSRPLVTCGQGIGYLPGTLDDKVAPFMRPLLEAFEEFFSNDELDKYIDSGKIELIPLELLRGLTISSAVIIADELQNATYTQLRMLLTRIGKETRLVMCGDITQTDLNGHAALWDVIKRFRPDLHPEISIVEMGPEDIVRHGLIRWVEERLG